MHILRLKEEVRKSQAVRKRGLFDPPPTRLDRRTILNGNTATTNEYTGWLKAQRQARIQHWKAQGVITVGWSRYMPRKGRSGMPGTGIDREGNEERATRRAKMVLQGICLTLAVDRLLTLTYRENMLDKIKARDDVNRFMRLIREALPGFKCVGVFERQKRGAWHVHLGLSGWCDVKLLRRCWRKAAIGDENSGDANVDIAFEPDGNGNRFSKTARYLGKYIGKDMLSERTLGERRYYVSEQIERPVEYMELKAPNDIAAIAEVKGLVQERLGVGFSHVWIGDGCGWIIGINDSQEFSDKPPLTRGLA